MNLKNCKKCGSMFAYRGSDICQNCSKAEDDNFKKVKEYLKENPGAALNVVVEDTGVPGDEIIKFLRESRLEIKSSDHYILSCEKCRKKIPNGRFCKECSAGIQSELQGVIPKAEPEKSRETDGVKFRLADRYRKK